MPGISSARYPSFPIRGRPEVCADWARLLSGVPRWPIEGRNTEDTVSLLENRPTFQRGRVGVPVQQKCLLKILATQTELPVDFPELSIRCPCVITSLQKNLDLN